MKNTELEQNHFSKLEEVMNLQNSDPGIVTLPSWGAVFYLNSILFT